MVWHTQHVGQFLVDKGEITVRQLEEALQEQAKTGQMLGTVLVRMGFIRDEQAFLSLLARKFGVELVSLRSLEVPGDVLARLPAKVVNHYKVFPVRHKDNTLVVAMSNPEDVSVMDDLSMIAGAKIQPAFSGEIEILEAIRAHYGVGADTIEKMMSGPESPSEAWAEASVAEERFIETIDEKGPEASISLFLNQILFAAYKDHATDIHIEPFENELRIRYRIDGELYDVKVPGNIRFFRDEIISRIKILSNLNIAERRLPQDGRFKVQVKGHDLDLRVAFLPTPNGESVVIRILNTAKLYSFDELGFAAQERAWLEALLQKSHGIIFLTGPTGSGKTTTLYSCLALLNKDDTKIITVEDPIEYQLRGAVQVQVHNDIGLHFSTALRSMLRADPDVMMVGEVRDVETARITIQAALTGHLVFSTLHTNDAASGIARLMDMGIEPYLIASAVECFIAQRLVRVVCPACRIRMKVTQEMIRDFDLSPDDVLEAVIYEAVGCKACRMTGFNGRIAIVEFLMLDDDIRAMIVSRASAVEIKDKAIAKGMKTLRRHGWEKVLSGHTTPGEVLRITHED